MKLSELAYLSVKRAVGDMGKSMSYGDFCRGDAATDTYLSNSVDRVFSDINAFMGRLVQLEKIPARIEGFDVSGREMGNGVLIPFSDLSFTPNVIKSAFQLKDDGDYVSLRWSVFQNGVMVRDLAYDDRQVYVQYRISLPSFRYSDITQLESDSDGNVTDRNFDLYERYGIMEEAMPLCIDYVDSLQNRDSDASLANNLMIQTESRINGLNTHETLYLPKTVRRKFRI